MSKIKYPDKVTKTRAFFTNEHGKKYWIPLETYIQIQEAYNRICQKLDAPIIITGAVGSGKSNKAIGICGTWENFFWDRDYTLNQVHFSAGKVMSEMDRDDNYTRAINFDEAISGGSSQAAITKVGKALKTKLITKRFKKHLTVFTVDNLKELNEKIIERCVVWYHVYYERQSNGKYVKGKFKPFSPDEAMRVYEDLKEKKYRDILKHPIFLNKNLHFEDPDYSGLWYSDDDYNEKKSKDTSEEESKNEDIKKKYAEAYILNKVYGVTQKKIGTYFKVDRSTIADWVSKVDAITRDVIDEVLK